MRPDSQQGGNEPLWLRRMVFVSNRGLIQSEAHLMPQQVVLRCSLGVFAAQQLCGQACHELIQRCPSGRLWVAHICCQESGVV